MKASFNLAFKSGKKTGWIKVASFQKLAEIVEQHLKKGNRVVVSGSLNQEQWESEGTKRTSFKLIAVKTPPPLITRSVGVCEKSLSVNNNEKEMKRLS
ncbi:MAG: single-stranded DNA-binding protein [Proteobacteria bacterium]|nr:single-stranded DNA-binding protein [Pseudomonadota bacterium]